MFAPEFAIAVLRRRSGQLQVPALRPRRVVPARLRGRQAGEDEELLPLVAEAGAKEGELTFVSGHPGGTDRRAHHRASSSTQRDVVLPETGCCASPSCAACSPSSSCSAPSRSASRTRTSSTWRTATRRSAAGTLALAGPRRSSAQLVAKEERAARRSSRTTRAAKDALPAPSTRSRRRRSGCCSSATSTTALERRASRRDALRHRARPRARRGRASAKPNAERLREYRESNLPALTQELFSEAPIYPELETLLLGLLPHRSSASGSAPDHPAVKKVLGKESPEELAKRVVDGHEARATSRSRKQLWEGGKAAVDGVERSAARARAPRSIRTRAPSASTFEDEVDVRREEEPASGSPRRASRSTARTTYPDATFTLRLSYGAVKGWNENGKPVAPFTTFAGAFERHTGREPVRAAGELARRRRTGST